MLAAQCNKITSKSPPPLADAAVGKGFHPWKKPESSLDQSSLLLVPQQRSSSFAPTTSPSYSRSGTSLTGSGSYSDILYPQATAASASQPETSQYLQKMHGEPAFVDTGIAGMYSRVTSVSAQHYEAWPFAFSAHGHNLKSDVSASVNTVPPFWDVHSGSSNLYPDVTSPTSGLHSQMSANYSNDLKLGLGSGLGTSSSSLFSSGQQLIQDPYKSMYSSQNELGASSVSPFLSRPGVSNIPSPKSQKRYSGRATCACPNCHEAERLGPAGAHLIKKNLHSCHIPGCGKVYGKTSHLKAHLR